MRTPIVAGNWKLNGSRDSAKALALAVAEGAPSGVDVVLCPSFVHLAAVAELIGGKLGLAAQTVSNHEQGAFTGEVSASMLKDLAVTMALVGHSERRVLFAEDDASCLTKVQSLLACGLSPILCVGESLAERDAGLTESVVAGQVSAVFASLDANQAARCLIAYEPVWAIGTGLSASAEQAQQVHQHIRQQIAQLHGPVAEQLRILYGGSVKPSNAQELFAQTDIDGGLIGGASLQSDDFLAICRAAASA